MTLPHSKAYVTAVIPEATCTFNPIGHNYIICDEATGKIIGSGRAAATAWRDAVATAKLIIGYRRRGDPDVQMSKLLKKP